ncbi:hypothetical protein LBMAG42_26570 [Deltaproteobacteria bacterium]|nr:hypothetical protein LBMAG42_26570 [Deltaproteobacteria bacterium]
MHPHPEQLPGEPPVSVPAGAVLWLRVIVGALALVLLTLVTLPGWLPYLLLVAAYGWPPNVPRRAQIRRYLAASWATSTPGLTAGRRAWLTILILKKVATIPVWGSAWLFDELLYKRELDAVELRAPLFEISAGRSGSTQLARYLEDDPALAAPSLLQFSFPYLWMWRLAPHTLGRLISASQVRAKFEQMLPEAFHERHEGDPFRTDTFEAALYLPHLNHLSLFFGPDFAVAEFSPSRISPSNRELWERDFVVLLDRIGRKRLLQVPAGDRPRLFVKGHFLCAADALARRYPDARFLTVIRAPSKRIQSAINYLRVNPWDSTLGPPSWSCLAEGILRSEVAYCEAEQAWFTAPNGPARTVVRFEDYVRDLPGTMRRIYAECMEGPVPATVPKEHAPRRRSHYQVDRSLEQLGIDAAALNERLAAYVKWCRATPPTT